MPERGMPTTPLERLRLVPDPGAYAQGDTEIDAIHVYPSSVFHTETGEPLITVYPLGRGMRLTREQAQELHDWIGEWLQ